MTVKAPQIIVDFRDFPLGSASSICLGNFDGIHLGHQRIISTCLDSAKRYDLVSVVFTFHPHPSRVLAQGRSIDLLLTREEKRELLSLTGVKWILEQSFTPEFSQIEAAQFTTDILFGAMNAKSIVVGSNFRFGRGAKGTPELLSAQKFFDTTVISSVEGREHEVISSSKIRDWVRAGAVREARTSLGYPFFMTGNVISGKKMGHTLGFPTANLKTEKECMPAKGVYLTISEDLESHQFFASLTNIGVRPTIENDGKLSIESHLIDFKDDLYERPMRLFFIDRIRNEIRFENLDSLKKQIEIDLQIGKALLINLQMMQTLNSPQVLSVKNSDSLLQQFQPFEKLENLA